MEVHPIITHNKMSRNSVFTGQVWSYIAVIVIQCKLVLGRSNFISWFTDRGDQFSRKIEEEKKIGKSIFFFFRPATMNIQLLVRLLKDNILFKLIFYRENGLRKPPQKPSIVVTFRSHIAVRRRPDAQLRRVISLMPHVLMSNTYSAAGCVLNSENGHVRKTRGWVLDEKCNMRCE